MKEIKFRAWDKYNKCMWTVSQLSFYDPGMDYGKEGIAVHFKEITPWAGTNLGPGKGCELMQFTGLKDKNCKEIFDQDILKDSASGDNFHCEWSKDDGAFYFTNSRGDYYAANEIVKYLEIIGNIYENPELLK